MFFAFSRFSSTFQHYTVQKANVLYIKTGQRGHILTGLKQCRGLGNPQKAVRHSRFHIAAGLWEAVFPCFSHVRGFPARSSTTPCRKQMFYTSKKVSGGIFGEVGSNTTALGAPRRPQYRGLGSPQKAVGHSRFHIGVGGCGRRRSPEGSYAKCSAQSKKILKNRKTFFRKKK